MYTFTFTELSVNYPVLRNYYFGQCYVMLSVKTNTSWCLPNCLSAWKIFSQPNDLWSDQPKNRKRVWSQTPRVTALYEHHDLRFQERKVIRNKNGSVAKQETTLRLAWEASRNMKHNQQNEELLYKPRRETKSVNRNWIKSKGRMNGVYENSRDVGSVKFSMSMGASGDTF